MTTTYIAGPMSGFPEFNKPAFFQAEEDLQHHGPVLNPARLPLGLTENAYMDIAVAMIRASDQIAMLPGWKASAGAHAEYALAVKLEKRVIFL